MSKSTQAQSSEDKKQLKAEHLAKSQEEAQKRKSLEVEIEQMTSNVKSFQTDLEKYRSEVQQSEQQMKNYLESRANIKKELSALNDTRAQRYKVYNDVRVEVAAAKKECELLAELIKDTKEDLQQQEKLTERLDKSQKRHQELEGKLKVAQDNFQAFSIKTKELMDVHMSFINKEVEESDRLSAKKEKVQDLLNMISNLEREVKARQDKLADFNHEAKQLSSFREDKLSYLPDFASDINLLVSREGMQYINQNFDPQVPERNVIWTTDYKVELPVRANLTGPGSEVPETIVDMFQQVVELYGDRPAMTYQKTPNNWVSQTYNEFYEDCLKFGKACISVGLSYYAPVLIIGFNSPEWAISFFGSIFAKFLPVGMYTTNSSDSCEYVTNHCGGELLVAENAAQLSKYYTLGEKCPTVKYYVVYKEGVPKDLPAHMKGKVFTWEEFLTRGASFVATKVEDTIEHHMQSIKPGNCASFIYTSGTTGMPKAVMVSHDNYVWVNKMVLIKEQKIIEPLMGKGRILSYLPMSHVAGQIVDFFMGVSTGANVFYPDASVLQTELVKFVQVAKPTYFLGVPRVWEKIEEKLGDSLSGATGIKKRLLDWAMSIGISGTFDELHNRSTPMFWGLAKRLYGKIKTQLGLDECSLYLTGAAPMKQTTKKFFLSINIPITGVYGMSETTAPFTYTYFDRWKEFEPAFCKETGATLRGMELVIEGPDKDGKGEICMRGRNIFMGYYKNEESTRKTINKRGFVLSGDEGMIGKNDSLFITGRLKELIITAGGQNIPPVLIENQLTLALPIVSQAVVIGDKRKYLTVLLCLKTKTPQDLSDEVIEFLKKRGSSAKTIKEAISCPKVNEIIKKGLEAANKKAISNAQRVQKYTILPLEFTVDSGLVTPTMKLKRNVISATFQKEIESMYIDSKL